MNKNTTLINDYQTNYRNDLTPTFNYENVVTESKISIVDYNKIVVTKIDTYTCSDSIHTFRSNPVKKFQSAYREMIKNLFSIQENRVLDFIDSNIELAILLIEACKNIRKSFPNEKLDLAFVDDMPDKLEIIINGFVDDDNAFLKFNEFNENWWFPRIEENTVTMYPFIVLNVWG
jgi:hypothetical protein